MGTGEFSAGGNPAMDYWHPIRGEVEILPVASCYWNRDKLRPLGLYGDFTFPLVRISITSFLAFTLLRSLICENSSKLHKNMAKTRDKRYPSFTLRLSQSEAEIIAWINNVALEQINKTACTFKCNTTSCSFSINTVFQLPPDPCRKPRKRVGRKLCKLITRICDLFILIWSPGLLLRTVNVHAKTYWGTSSGYLPLQFKPVWIRGTICRDKILVPATKFFFWQKWLVYKMGLSSLLIRGTSRIDLYPKMRWPLNAQSARDGFKSSPSLCSRYFLIVKLRTRVICLHRRGWGKSRPEFALRVLGIRKVLHQQICSSWRVHYSYS